MRKYVRRRRMRRRITVVSKQNHPAPILETMSSPATRRVFLLSPAHCGGERAKLLFRPQARFELAVQLRTPMGAPLGEVFQFLSGLYFRGKLAYAHRFANPPADVGGQWIITTNRGLLPADTYVTLSELAKMGRVPIDAEDARYRRPLKRSLIELNQRCGDACEFVLLGSIATGKYVDVLRHVLGSRLRFPAEFVGRGDMSRGGLMLRCVDEGRELTYVEIDGATRHGTRPPKLQRRVLPRPSAPLNRMP
jgi:hypothetical protein